MGLTQQLRALAEQLRKQASVLAQTRMVKSAQVLLAAKGLVELKNKLLGGSK